MVIRNTDAGTIKVTLPLFFVDVKQQPMNVLYDINRFSHTRVKVEKPYSYVLFSKCQICNYKKGFCNYIPRVVRCGEDHWSHKVCETKYLKVITQHSKPSRQVGKGVMFAHITADSNLQHLQAAQASTAFPVSTETPPAPGHTAPYILPPPTSIDSSTLPKRFLLLQVTLIYPSLKC